MLKNHPPFCLLVSFCTTEYLMSITMNGMCENLSPLDMAFLSNIISLISPKITLVLALCILLAFCKNGSLLLPWEPAKTGAAGLIPPALYMPVVWKLSYISAVQPNFIPLVNRYPCTAFCLHKEGLLDSYIFVIRTMYSAWNFKMQVVKVGNYFIAHDQPLKLSSSMFMCIAKHQTQQIKYEALRNALT